MRDLRLALVLLLLATAGLAGCGGDGKTSENEPKQSRPETRALPPMIGTPVAAGYFDGGLTLLNSAEPDSGQALMPTGKAFLLAVRFDVRESARLVPTEYSVIVDKRRYRPKGVSFGKARDTFFNVEAFVADEVALKLRGSDTIETNEQGRLDACNLSTGQVHLLYRVPGSGLVTVRYSGQDYQLRPTTAVALGFEEPKPSQNEQQAGQPEAPEGPVLEVESSRLAFASLDGRDTEVLEVELKLKSSTYEIVELKLGENFFLEGHGDPQTGRRTRRGRRSRRVLVDLQEESMRLLEGTIYVDNTYNDRPVTEIESGGLAISVRPGRPVTTLFIFPNPPFENGLALHFPGRPPIDLIPAGDVLGEIRPAIPRGVAKIPRAPIIGEPVKLHVIEGPLALPDGKPLPPAAGHRFLAVKFDIPGAADDGASRRREPRMHPEADASRARGAGSGDASRFIEGQRQFVARDYELTDEQGERYFPVAVSFGHSPAYRVPDGGYEAIGIAPGESDRVVKQRGGTVSWQYAHPEFLILFEVPDEAETLYFSHGDRRLKLTPVSEPVAWRDLRPQSTVAGLGDSGKKGRTPSSGSGADDADRAASRLRLGKLLLEKDKEKARQYFRKAIELAPDSEAGKEAKKLLNELNE